MAEATIAELRRRLTEQNHQLSLYAAAQDITGY